MRTAVRTARPLIAERQKPVDAHRNMAEHRGTSLSSLTSAVCSLREAKGERRLQKGVFAVEGSSPAIRRRRGRRSVNLSEMSIGRRASSVVVDESHPPHLALTGSHRGRRWRRGCYPAVTPALELVRFELREPANGRCPSVSVATCKLL